MLRCVSGTALGRFFGARGEENDGGLVGIDLRQCGELRVREEADTEKRGERLELADVLAQVLEVDVFDALDLHADAVDEFLRGDDAFEVHHVGRVVQVDRPVVQLSSTGNFFAMSSAMKAVSAATDAGSMRPTDSPGSAAKRLAMSFAPVRSRA